jgi:multidrug transporter EmrE-like cation transporter
MPIALNLLAAVFGAFGQYFYKLGSSRLSQIPLYKNWPIFTGAVLFCVVMVLFVVAFKLGGKLSVVYPVYATTFIWGMLIAAFMSSERINLIQVSGVFVIILGVGLVAFGHAR